MGEVNEEQKRVEVAGRQAETGKRKTEIDYIWALIANNRLGRKYGMRRQRR